MKKLVILIASIMCIVSMFLAKKINDFASDQSITDWPRSELASKIPEPNHYDRCDIVTDNGNLFWVYIYGMPFEDFDSYINDCRNFGYIDNNYLVGDNLYYGELSNTYGVQLTYNTYKKYMVIQLTSNANDPDKWKG